MTASRLGLPQAYQLYSSCCVQAKPCHMGCSTNKEAPVWHLIYMDSPTCKSEQGQDADPSPLACRCTVLLRHCEAPEHRKDAGGEVSD